jgi:hypothetical protein
VRCEAGRCLAGAFLRWLLNNVAQPRKRICTGWWSDKVVAVSTAMASTRGAMSVLAKMKSQLIGSGP